MTRGGEADKGILNFVDLDLDLTRLPRDASWRQRFLGARKFEALCPFDARRPCSHLALARDEDHLITVVDDDNDSSPSPCSVAMIPNSSRSISRYKIGAPYKPMCHYCQHDGSQEALSVAVVSTAAALGT